MRVNNGKYLQGCDICISSKAQRHKFYGRMQTLSVLTGKWKDLSIDFVTELSKSKDWRGVEYDLIFVIVDWLTEMVYYKPVLTTLTVEQRAEILIEELIKYHGLPDSIITDRGLLFTSKFCSFLCYYLNFKCWFNIVFYPQTNTQTERQNSTMEAYLRV